MRSTQNALVRDSLAVEWVVSAVIQESPCKFGLACLFQKLVEEDRLELFCNFAEIFIAVEAFDGFLTVNLAQGWHRVDRINHSKPPR